LNEILNPLTLNVRKYRIESASHEDVRVPFEITAYDFLEFAGQDLQEKHERSIVNALSNVKRSIDCLCDSLLFVMNYSKKSKKEKWDFPDKINFLGKLGIITPYVLRRINSMRNLLEHEFRMPEREDVETAFDVANLFYHATGRFTKRFPRDFELVNDGDNFVFAIEYDRKKHRTKIENKEGKSIEFGEDTKEYFEWLAKFFEIQYLLM